MSASISLAFLIQGLQNSSDMISKRLPHCRLRLYQNDNMWHELRGWYLRCSCCCALQRHKVLNAHLTEALKYSLLIVRGDRLRHVSSANSVSLLVARDVYLVMHAAPLAVLLYLVATHAYVLFSAVQLCAGGKEDAQRAAARCDPQLSMLNPGHTAIWRSHPSSRFVPDEHIWAGLRGRQAVLQ